MYYSSVMVEPSFFVTKGKQRLKQHGNVVYLKNKEEFEIELFNPTTNNILASIEIDGRSIGNGVIIRPGERLFLDRFLNSPNKFMFSTYLVEGNNCSVDRAIINNGRVVVKFYKEVLSYPSVSDYVYYPFVIDELSNIKNNVRFNTNNGIYTTGTYTHTISGSNSITVNNFPSGSGVSSSYYSNSNPTVSYSKRNLKETGKVEKGNISNQKFENYNGNFSPSPFKIIEWVIKPESNITSDSIKVYCTKCGRKKKVNDSYCGTCGTKY